MGDLPDKIRASLPGMSGIVLAVSMAGALLLFFYFNLGLNPRVFISDVHDTALVPEYSGSFSNAAVLVIWSAAVVAAISALYGRFISLRRRKFVASIALVNGLLALDDFFMAHEFAGLQIARLLGSENEGEDRQLYEVFVFAFFIVLGALWLVWMGREILNSLYPLLLLGLVGFAASVAVDLFPSFYTAFENQPIRVQTVVAVVEDLFKYVGIGGFAVYAWKTATPHLSFRDIPVADGSTLTAAGLRDGTSNGS